MQFRNELNQSIYFYDYDYDGTALKDLSTSQMDGKYTLYQVSVKDGADNRITYYNDGKSQYRDKSLM